MMTGRTALGCVAAALLVAACERPPVTSTQQGFRGTGMVAVSNPRLGAEVTRANAMPEPLPPTVAGGPLATSVYQNIQVLTDLDIAQFTRLMTAMTAWVSPEQGCAYCHAEDGNNASDVKYTKVVSRRMLEMVRAINADWPQHVGETGVTCYTCHRGRNVPLRVWFTAPDENPHFAGNRAGQNRPAPAVGLTAMPVDPLTSYLVEGRNVRVVNPSALVAGPGSSLQDTERTYAFMIHISESLGVNCTHCHNTRSLAAWDEGNPARLNAWHAIRMTQHLNVNYVLPLKDQLPAERLGPAGDVPKVGCGTCHQGLARPLGGAPMLADYPELRTQPPRPVAAPPVGGEPAAPPADQQT